MSPWNSGLSPKACARICGGLYLYIIVAGIFAELFVRGRFIVSGDAAATASNILGNESLFRVGFTGELLHLACDVGVAAILYVLLAPVDRVIALLAALMRFACDIVLAVASISHFAALRLLSGADYLDSFSPEQLQSAALLGLRLHGNAYDISLVFFGFCCLSLGYLIYRSGYLPRLIGVLMALAGVCYLFNSFGNFLAPTFAASFFPALFVPMFIAELSLTLWLLIAGVNMTRWNERVGRDT
jgi:Domain of unknown function (DUF4386)